VPTDERKLLGMLTPSSNTVLEPTTAEILRSLPDVTAHFGRFRVKEITLDDAALGQFENTALVTAAELLADSKVDVICWNGTSGGWIGADADRALCRDIEAATGIPATTSTLALLQAFNAMAATRYALITPYLETVQRRIVQNFSAFGLDCVAECHLSERDNFAFSEFGEETIAHMVRDVAAADPQAIAICCTNFRGARIAASLEAELGITVIDSVSVAVWKSLLMAGVDPARIRGWGRLFDHGSQQQEVKVHG